MSMATFGTEGRFRMSTVISLVGGKADMLLIALIGRC
jgi:hypothetical protein